MIRVIVVLRSWSDGRTEAIKVDGGFTSMLWMTDVTLQGDGQSITNSMTFSVSSGSRAFLQGWLIGLTLCISVLNLG